MALATHIAGSTEEFVKLMNQRAAEIGMKSTHFTSVHGLPVPSYKPHDISTPRDLSLLAREVLRHPETLQYTGCRTKSFGEGKRSFIMTNHNRLIGTFEGCDGLKTGFASGAGFLIVATAVQNGNRIIAVVTGCQKKKTRDMIACELLMMK